MKLFATFLVLAATAVLTSAKHSGRNESTYLLDADPDDEDSKLDALELITKYGYPCEKHQVVTEDRYVLTVFRIPRGKDDTSRRPGKRPVVLLQHGLMLSAIDWVIMGPGKSLAYLLADRGYDVWLGNSRGNVYSRKHLDKGPKDKSFWRFSWHENGIYDLPAEIDYMLNITSQEKLFYVGHSMGTTMFYVLMSQRPEYNEKIHLMSSLAPIAYANNMMSPVLQFLAQFQHAGSMLSTLTGPEEFIPTPDLLNVIEPPICKRKAISEAICLNALFIICGFDSTELDKEKLEAILAHVPAGASTKQVLHYGQGINKGHFRQYDYGLLKNFIFYHRTSPPDYDLRKITAPVALYYSKNDLLAGVLDVDRLYKELGNVVAKHKVSLDRFNHIDFVWAKSAWDYVYKFVIEKMEEYIK